MRNHTVALCSLAMAAGLTAFAQAQTAPPAASNAAAHAPNKVGTINIQAAILNTKDGQKAMQEFNTKLEPRKKELDKKAADIRDLQDKLQRGGAAMSDTAKQDLARSIDTKTKAYNRDMEDAQAEYEGENRKMIDELGQKITQVIDRYAQANGFSIILDISNPNTPVLYASNSVDITKEIIEMYDKTMPSSLTNAPKSGTAPAAPKGGPSTLTPSATPSTTPASTTPPPVKKQP